MITLVSGRPAAPPLAPDDPRAHPVEPPQVYRLSLERSSAQALSLDGQSGRAEDAGHGWRVGGRRLVPRGSGRLVPVSSRRHVDPCMRFSRTRLTDALHRRHSALPA